MVTSLLLMAVSTALIVGMAGFLLLKHVRKTRRMLTDEARAAFQDLSKTVARERALHRFGRVQLSADVSGSSCRRVYRHAGYLEGNLQAKVEAISRFKMVKVTLQGTVDERHGIARDYSLTVKTPFSRPETICSFTTEGTSYILSDDGVRTEQAA